MSESFKDKIKQALMDSKQISAQDVESAFLLQRQKGISLGKALIEKGFINEKELIILLVKELHIPSINLNKYKIDASLKESISEKVARHYHVVPVSKISNTLTVALSDPLNLVAIDDLKNIAGMDVDVVMSTDTDIMKTIDAFYGSKLMSEVNEVSKDIDVEDFEIISEQSLEGSITSDDGEQAPIVRMVDLIIQEALRQRASDIHMEPTPDYMRVRFRVDGILQDALKFPKESQNAVIVRLKIMARIDITTNWMPQDGRFKLRLSRQEVDFRVSLLPTIYGQKIVLRVLDKKKLAIGLDGLGFSKKAMEELKDVVTKPFGMVLVTGPTGSGKSTTLYSLINQINTVDKNIVTIEDPVEYLIEGLTQIQARPEIDLTFASGLRAILRQSPDVVMVGEIRDAETADIAIKAALTGQIVFSTLHTNDAAGALTRLVDMGIEPFLVASSLVAVIAQRLCRQICIHCKEPVVIPAQVLDEFKISPPNNATFFKGKGCSLCRQTGYLGRIGITEILQVDETVREMLIKGDSSDSIKHYAIESANMSTLRDDILKKLFGGLTTLEEVSRITSES